MIHWLTQSFDDHPSLAEGIAPEGLLSGEEQQKLASLRLPKRRREWLLGRWTAKHLLQALFEQECGVAPEHADLRILNDGDGVPLLLVEERAFPPEALTLARSLDLSISHSGDFAFCAVALEAGVRVGADIERIEARHPPFADTFFTQAELALLPDPSDRLYNMVVTIIWSAKEAALKAVRKGLSVDTRRVSCALALRSEVLYTSWQALRVRCDLQEPSRSLPGWWRVHNGYIETIALLDGRPEAEQAPSLAHYCVRTSDTAFRAPGMGLCTPEHMSRGQVAHERLRSIVEVHDASICG